MRPTQTAMGLFSKPEKPFHDPWAAREAWRYQAPFKPNSRLLGYQTLWKPVLAATVAYFAWEEVVHHGPLRKFVYGDKPAHGHDEHH